MSASTGRRNHPERFELRACELHRCRPDGEPGGPEVCLGLVERIQLRERGSVGPDDQSRETVRGGLGDGSRRPELAPPVVLSRHRPGAPSHCPPDAVRAGGCNPASAPAVASASSCCLATSARLTRSSTES